MPSAEDELATQARASLDALLQYLDSQIAAVELTPIPSGKVRASGVGAALQAKVEQLCRQRASNAREQARWLNEAERAVRENDDARARNALARHAEHFRLFQEADGMLAEYRVLITEVRRSFSPVTERGTGEGTG